jgi:hypothetical protein
MTISPHPASCLLASPFSPGATVPGRSQRGRKPKPATNPLRHPRAVSPGFRELVLTTYPALAGESRKPWAYRRIMEYCLFQPYRKRGERLELRFDHETVALLVGVTPGTHGQAAMNWIADFSADVLDLRPTGYVAKERVRTIAPEIHPLVLAARDGELARVRDGASELVCFLDGNPVSLEDHRQMARTYKLAVLSTLPEPPSDHPALELVTYLNRQPSDLLESLLAAKWQTLIRMRDELPEGPKRDSVTRVLAEIADSCPMIYATKKKTRRVYASRTTIHQLPKDFRKAALEGCVSLDLRSAQLAIIGEMWQVDSLQEFLAAGREFWSEMFDYLSLQPSEENKKMLKPAIYSTAFGRDDQHIAAQLAYGEEDVDIEKSITSKRKKRKWAKNPTELEAEIWCSEYQRQERRNRIEAKVAQGQRDEGLGLAMAQRFMSHHLVRDLLNARNRTKKRIQAERGSLDAFGDWVAMSDEQDVKSVMAAEAQSWELRLMLAVLPVLKADPDIRLLSWLHDGISVMVPPGEEGERKIRRLQDAVDAEAKSLNFYTALERES